MSTTHRCVVASRRLLLPLGLAEDKWVTAVEIHPTARSVVHHALYFLDSTGSAVDEEEPSELTGLAGVETELVRGALVLVPELQEVEIPKVSKNRVNNKKIRFSIVKN